MIKHLLLKSQYDMQQQNLKGLLLKKRKKGKSITKKEIDKIRSEKLEQES